MFCARLILPCVLLVGFGVQVRGGELTSRASAIAPTSVPVLTTWEVRIPASLVPSPRNIYRPELFLVRAEIQPPSGNRITVDAFPYQAYTRTEDAGGNEHLRRQGKPEWRLRYTPSEIGNHAVRLIARTHRTPKVLAQLTFQATKVTPAPDGFLRVNPNVPTQFSFASGRGFFALGHNVCWVKRERGTYGYDAYFKKMRAAGENFTRIWLCTWGISLDGRTPFSFDLTDAWRLDTILQAAQKNGIYVKLCLTNFHDFRANFDQSPFSSKNGGPCKTKASFFTREAAKRQYRARLQFIIARYGSYRSLMAWELFNEMNYALHETDLAYTNEGRTEAEIARDYLIPWTKEMAATIRKIDLYRHLITTSLGNKSTSAELWKLRDLSFVQYHAYLNYYDFYGPEGDRDAARAILVAQAKINTFNKPAFVSEYGFLGDSTDGSRSAMNQKDPTGIHLHNAIWAGTFSGASGTPMLWWWDNYIEQRGLYFHYKGLSTFLKDVDWSRPRVPMRVEGGRLRILALRGAQTTLFWVQNKESTWYNQIVRQVTPSPVKKTVLTFKNFPRGRYKLTWFDPHRGVELIAYEIPAPEGRLRLNVPTFTLDIAARLVWVGP